MTIYNWLEVALVAVAALLCLGFHLAEAQAKVEEMLKPAPSYPDPAQAIARIDEKITQLPPSRHSREDREAETARLVSFGAGRWARLDQNEDPRP